MAEKNQIPGAEGIFTWPSDEPHLIGGRCKSCGTYYFPKYYVVHKPGCKEREIEEIPLSRKGKLDTYTVQYYPPPPPFITTVPFVPYAIGWVALPEGIAVAGIITDCKIEDIKQHMNLELVIEKAWEEEDGTEVLTWKWRPAQ